MLDFVLHPCQRGGLEPKSLKIEPDLERKAGRIIARYYVECDCDDTDPPLFDSMEEARDAWSARNKLST
jgi:hypothetical protein